MSGLAASSPMHRIEARFSPMRPLMVALAVTWALLFLFLYVLSLRVEAWVILGVVLVAGGVYCAWRWPFAALLGLIALLPFQPLPTMVGQATGIPYIHAISGVKEGLFVIAILSGLNRHRTRLQAVDYILVAVILMALVSRLFGGYWMGLKDDWELILPFAAGRFLPIPSRHEVRWVKVVLASMSVVAVLGILEYMFIPLKLRLLWLGLTQAPNQFSAAGYSGERIGSTLSGPAEFGNLCALALILLVVYRSRLNRRWLAAAGLLAFGLFLSLTRSAWIATAAGAIIFELRSGRWWRVLVVATACVALFIALLPTLGLERFYTKTVSGRDPSLQGHVASIETYVDVTIDHPLGTGPGTAGPRALERDPTAVNVENSYLTISVQYGVLSGVLFALFCLLCLKGCLGDPSSLGMAATSMMLAYMLMLGIMPAHQSLTTAAMVLFPVGAVLTRKGRLRKRPSRIAKMGALGLGPR